jgi:hypothetical protein
LLMVSDQDKDSVSVFPLLKVCAQGPSGLRS